MQFDESKMKMFSRLFSGRSSEVRARMAGFVRTATTNSFSSLHTREPVQFYWSKHRFNNEQRKNIVAELLDKQIITVYNRGFKFKDYKSASKFSPATNCVKFVKMYSNVDCASVLRSDGNERVIKDSSVKELKRYAKFLQKNLEYPITALRRVYNYSEEFGGRVYSNYQQLPKAVRSQIVGNGIELDYKNNHVKIILSVTDGDTGADIYDALLDDSFQRIEIKQALNAYLNSSNAVLVLTNPFGNFKWSSVKAEKFVKKIEATFPQLASVSKNKFVGLRLQKFEGDVTMRVIREAMHNEKLVLPVHDSYVCKPIDSEWLSSTMTNAWNCELSHSSNSIRSLLACK